MGVLEAFMTTWSRTRDTFGQGVPQTGAEFDKSAALQRLQSTVQSAAPGTVWRGSAASAYDTANTEHAMVFGRLADLDARLADQVGQSARIVDSGRRNLDAVRQWVSDAAASVPPGRNREQLLLPIVRSGLDTVTNIVTMSNTSLNSVGETIQGIRSEYAALGNQRFGGIEEAPTTSGVVGDSKNAPPVPGDPVGPGEPVPPGDPFIGNDQFGRWNTISTSPMGPFGRLSDRFRPFGDDSPAKVGPTTGWYTPNQTWVADEDAPIVQYKESYRFRLTGVSDTPYTRVVFDNGQWRVQQWQQNVYEYQKNTTFVAGGGLAGMPPGQNIDRTWERISLPQIATLSSQNTTTTYYLPDGCGGTVDFVGGITDDSRPPGPPIMVRPR